MTYSESSKKATLKHRREKRKQIPLEYKIEEFELEIEPAIKASGLHVATYIKLAVKEKIERDNLARKNKQLPES